MVTFPDVTYHDAFTKIASLREYIYCEAIIMTLFSVRPTIIFPSSFWLPHDVIYLEKTYQDVFHHHVIHCDAAKQPLLERNR